MGFTALQDLYRIASYIQLYLKNKHNITTTLKPVFIKTILLILGFLFISSFGHAQSPIVEYYNKFKSILSPKVIRLSDEEISYPIVGLTNILNTRNIMTGGTYTDIELWVIDANGKVIYSNIITTRNSGGLILDQEYSHYMHLKRNYELNQRNTVFASSK